MRNKYSFETIFLGLCLLFFLMATVGLFIGSKNNLFSYFYFITPIFWIFWLASVGKQKVLYLIYDWILISGVIFMTILNLSLPGVYGARGSDVTLFIAYLPLLLPAVVIPKNYMSISLQVLADKGGLYEVLALWGEATVVAFVSSVIFVVYVKVLKNKLAHRSHNNA